VLYFTSSLLSPSFYFSSFSLPFHLYSCPNFSPAAALLLLLLLLSLFEITRRVHKKTGAASAAAQRRNKVRQATHCSEGQASHLKPVAVAGRGGFPACITEFALEGHSSVVSGGRVGGHA